MDDPTTDPLLALARLFASAILRRKARGILAASENSPNSVAAQLELSPETALTVAPRVNGAREFSQRRDER
jgi:hypothetical protein